MNRVPDFHLFFWRILGPHPFPGRIPFQMTEAQAAGWAVNWGAEVREGWRLQDNIGSFLPRVVVTRVSNAKNEGPELIEAA